MEANADLLTETDALLDAKRRLLRRLLAEMEAADMDTARLMAARDAAARDATVDAVMEAAVPPPQTAPVSTGVRLPASCSAVAVSPVCGAQLSHLPSHTKGQDNDSNSDTGLSSLHSSSEEGVYILDTLV